MVPFMTWLDGTERNFKSKLVIWFFARPQTPADRDWKLIGHLGEEKQKNSFQESPSPNPGVECTTDHKTVPRLVYRINQKTVSTCLVCSKSLLDSDIWLESISCDAHIEIKALGSWKSASKNNGLILILGAMGKKYCAALNTCMLTHICRTSCSDGNRWYWYIGSVNDRVTSITSCHPFNNYRIISRCVYY